MPARRPFAFALRLHSFIASAALVTLAAAGAPQARADETGPARPADTASAKAAGQPQRVAALMLPAAATASAPAPRARANGEHPAVLQWRRAHAGQAPFDTDHFVVLPPAGAHWALESASEGQAPQGKDPYLVLP